MFLLQNKYFIMDKIQLQAYLSNDNGKKHSSVAAVDVNCPNSIWLQPLCSGKLRTSEAFLLGGPLVVRLICKYLLFCALLILRTSDSI